MTGRPARYSCEFKYVLFFNVVVQGQLPNNLGCPYRNYQADCNISLSNNFECPYGNNQVDCNISLW